MRRSIVLRHGLRTGLSTNTLRYHAFRMTRVSKSRLHRFTCQGHTLTIDPESLLLHEELRSWRPPWRPKDFKQLNVSDRAVPERDLEAERRSLNEHLRHERDYLYLNVSHACNMRCHYCFSQGGTYGLKAQLMSPEVATAAVDWLFRIGTGHHVTVNFFGGEPLLNMPAVRAALAHARKLASGAGRTFRAVISTNGTLDLCELADVLCSVAHKITVSIDGSAGTHDLNRPFHDGSPTYETIAENVARYARTVDGSRLAAKITWRRGQSDLVSMTQSVLALGFRHLYVGRETSFRASSFQPENDGNFGDLDNLVSAYERLGHWYVDLLNKGDSIVVQPLYSMLISVMRAQVLRRACTAGTATWCVSPDGDIYACHRFVEHPNSKLGNVMSDDPVPTYPANLPSHGFVASCCDGCWARYWCFSNSCVYLIAIGRDFHLLPGFCRHMRRLLENICFQVSRLSLTGRKVLRSAISWPHGVPIKTPTQRERGSTRTWGATS